MVVTVYIKGGVFMFFKTTEQHENLRERIRKFAEEEVKPIALMLDQESKFPSEAVEKLAQMGMMGLPYPKKIWWSRFRCN